MRFRNRLCQVRSICYWRQSLQLVFIVSFLVVVLVIVFRSTSDKCRSKHRMCEFCTLMENDKLHLNTSYYRDLDLRIIVIVYNRANSLQRLLDSINRAHYFGDNIALHVWIDRSDNGTIDSRTYKVAKGFTFKHGHYYIHNQTCHVGIYGQWIGTWYPLKDSTEYAVILEDDLTVSPYFYKWLKLMHTKYDHRPEVNGYALQGISIKHGVMIKGYLDVKKTHKVFLYPVLGTWGFSPNNRNWRAFSDWYMLVRQAKKFTPFVEGLIPSVWYKRNNNMWSMWFIYHAWEQREYTVYSNFKGHQGLAINWKEPGLHYSKNDKETEPDPLLLDWKPEYEDLPQNPVIVDVNGNEMIPES